MNPARLLLRRSAVACFGQAMQRSQVVRQFTAGPASQRVSARHAAALLDVASLRTGAQRRFAPFVSVGRRFASTEAAPEEAAADEFPTPPEAVGGEEETDPEVERIIEEIVHLNVLQASQLVKVLRKRLGLPEQSAGMMMPMGAMPVGGAAGAAPAEEEEVVEKTDFNVKLTGFDAKSKIKVIKEVRALTGLGLKEAKEVVDKVPGVLKEGLKKEEAEEWLAKLKEVGAEVELE